MKYLITSSLLDSFDYLKNCPANYQPKAIDDFIAMLQRKPRPTSEACQRGIDFERLVCDNCNNMTEEQFKGYASAYWTKKGCKNLESALFTTCEISNRCRGGKQQVALMKDVTFGDKEFHLFGYSDVLFPDKIIDIKTTARYTGETSYTNRSQHLIYALCTGIEKFEYLVAEYKGNYPVDLHSISLSLDIEECGQILANRIQNIVEFMQNSGLWEDYVNIFTIQHKDKR